MRVLLAAAAGLARDILETLPASEDDAGSWLAGFCWAFVTFWVILVLVTMLWARAHGVAL